MIIYEHVLVLVDNKAFILMPDITLNGAGLATVWGGAYRVRVAAQNNSLFDSITTPTCHHGAQDHCACLGTP